MNINSFYTRGAEHVFADLAFKIECTHAHLEMISLKTNKFGQMCGNKLEMESVFIVEINTFALFPT